MNDGFEIMLQGSGVSSRKVQGLWFRPRSRLALPAMEVVAGTGYIVPEDSSIVRPQKAVRVSSLVVLPANTGQAACSMTRTNIALCRTRARSWAIPTVCPSSYGNNAKS